MVAFLAALLYEASLAAEVKVRTEGKRRLANDIGTWSERLDEWMYYHLDMAAWVGLDGPYMSLEDACCQD